MASYDNDAVRSRVSGPAMALLVTGILGIVAQVLSAGFTILNPGRAAQEAQLRQMQEQNPAAAQQMQQQMQMMQALTGPVGIGLAALAIAIGVVIIVGANKMKNLQSYGLAMTASILAMIPCLSPCCLLGLPFGIWAIVVLNNPDVKAAFR